MSRTGTDRTGRFRSFTLTTLLLALNLVALNLLVSNCTRARIDLTEERIYSITPVTERILASLDDTLTINGYFSEKTHPKLAPLIPRISDLLEEYQAVSGGRVRVEIIDPTGSEEAEQEASERFGVRPTPFQLASKYETGIVNAYFALVIRYGDEYETYDWNELVAIEPLPDGDVDVRLRNLEYDLTRAIRKVTAEFDRNVDLFESLETPVRLTAIITADSLPEIFADVPAAMRAAAEELEKRGGEHFEYRELDPSRSESVAAMVQQQFGARPMSLGLFGGESFYLYGILQIGERLEQLSLASEEISAASIREAVEQSIRRHLPGLLDTVGIVSNDPVLPPEVLRQLQMQGQLPPDTSPPEFQELRRILARDYDVKRVRPEEDEIPHDVDVLLVLKPREMSERAVYHIDQYLMRGGRVVIAAGNYDVALTQSGISVAPISTGLETWLDHFGIEIEKTLVLDDRNQAIPVPQMRETPFGAVRTWTMAPYPYLVQVQDEGFAHRDVAGSLAAVGIYWGSPIEVDPKRTGKLEVMPLLRSSERSWTSGDLDKVNRVDYTVPPRAEPQLLGVALAGRFNSYFAGKPVPIREEGTGAETSARVTLEHSPETRLVVIGDAEFLSDLIARSLGEAGGGFFLENLRFMENLIDWTTLDQEMIAIRSRGAGTRRLTRTETGQEMTIEAFNYAIPALILFTIAAWHSWRRRNAPSILQPDRTETKRRGSA